MAEAKKICNERIQASNSPSQIILIMVSYLNRSEGKPRHPRKLFERFEQLASLDVVPHSLEIRDDKERRDNQDKRERDDPK